MCVQEMAASESERGIPDCESVRWERMGTRELLVLSLRLFLIILIVRLIRSLKVDKIELDAHVGNLGRKKENIYRRPNGRRGC